MQIAVWGHPYSEYPEGQDGIDDFRRGFERMREAGITLYIPFVLTHTKAYFHGTMLGDAERDLLSPVMQCGREFGIDIHPIIGFGAVGVQTGGLYDPGDIADPPSFATSWRCARWPVVRETTVTVAQQMVAAYEPAGLHMDYMRYPNTVVLDQHPCHCERCRHARLQWLGKEIPDASDLSRPGVMHKEIQMRGEAITAVVEGLKQVARDADIPLSLAARARYLKDAVPEGQDWARWAADGLLDTVCPMSYNPCDDRFQAFLDQHKPLMADTGAIWLAGIGRRSSLGEISAQQMGKQIQMAVDAGAGGVCIFHAGVFEDEDYTVLRSLASA